MIRQNQRSVLLRSRGTDQKKRQKFLVQFLNLAEHAKHELPVWCRVIGDVISMCAQRTYTRRCHIDPGSTRSRPYFKGRNNFVNRRGDPSKTWSKKNEHQRNVAKRRNKRATSLKLHDSQPRWKLLLREFQIFRRSFSLHSQFIFEPVEQNSHKIPMISLNF